MKRQLFFDPTQGDENIRIYSQDTNYINVVNESRNPDRRYSIQIAAKIVEKQTIIIADYGDSELVLELRPRDLTATEFARLMKA